ncbi:MAG: hypothetical protein ACI9W6_002695 [Motiliproteus sp.]|jgi:hypothetical protein
MPQRLNQAARGIALVQLLLIVVMLALLAAVVTLLLQGPALEIPAFRSQPALKLDRAQPDNGDTQGSSSVVSRLSSVVAAVSGAKPTVSSGAGSLSPAPIVNRAPAILSAQLDLSLPDLNHSDRLFRLAVAELDPTQTLISLLIDKELIRKLVVSIDNMAQGRLSNKHRLLVPIKPPFRTNTSTDTNTDTRAVAEEELWLDGYNFSRYGLHVELLSAIDSSQWVELYQRYYPQLQQAYAELGYPRKAFHDRVLLALDHLLRSPVLDRPLLLVQPSVMYQFADPQLEQLSGVHKQMLRLGPVNTRRVLDSVRVLRAELVSLQPPS